MTGIISRLLLGRRANEAARAATERLKEEALEELENNKQDFNYYREILLKSMSCEECNEDEQSPESNA